ncbi:MAG: hypothetical protein HLUCCO02_05185 [Idiomarinaceae bacterium HL-53]|nr:MAG: hypothetical protein HLUCCO02_05185 [Idiomarinaceae bacterium HL-53]
MNTEIRLVYNSLIVGVYMNDFIVLARPHPFVVGEMATFLAEMNVGVRKLNHLDELSEVLVNAKAAVISTAVTSPIGEDAPTVYAKIRELNANIPIVFAGLLPLERTYKMIEHMMKNEPTPHGLVGIHERVGNPKLNSSGTALYFHKEDLLQLEYRKMASKLLKQHCGL